MKNEDINEWCMDAGNISKGLFLVAINNQKIPVSNQICPICNKGWNAPFKFAVKGNKVYHKKCLEKMGMMDEDVITE